MRPSDKQQADILLFTCANCEFDNWSLWGV